MSPAQFSESHIRAIGEALKSARENRGDNLAEAAFRIALSPSQLRAIESGDLRPFYSPSYFMQAAKRYANLLGIDLPMPPANLELSPRPIAAPVAEPPPSLGEITPSPAEALTTKDRETTPESSESEIAADPAPTLSDAQHGPRGLRWGWIAFAAAGLITLGILKISLEQAPKHEPAVAGVQSPVAPDTNEKNSLEATNSSPGPATPTSPPNNTAAPPPPTHDGQLAMQASTWVQIVKTNGEKINLKTEPGQKIEFLSGDTVAIAFGQPEKASLTIQGKSVNLAPFVTQDSPPRALVILNRIQQ